MKAQEVTIDPRVAREKTGNNIRNGHKNSGPCTSYRVEVVSHTPEGRKTAWFFSEIPLTRIIKKC